MNDDIPPLLPPEEMPPIRNQVDLHDHWRALMGPLGFAQASLWLQFVSSEDRVDGMVTRIDDLPARPDAGLLENLLMVCGEVLDNEVPGGRVAFLYTRPGTRRVTDDDRAWARGLRSAAHKAGVPCEPVHLANDEQLQVFAPDDLGLPDSAA